MKDNFILKWLGTSLTLILVGLPFFASAVQSPATPYEVTIAPGGSITISDSDAFTTFPALTDTYCTPADYFGLTASDDSSGDTWASAGVQSSNLSYTFTPDLPVGDYSFSLGYSCSASSYGESFTPAGSPAEAVGTAGSWGSAFLTVHVAAVAGASTFIPIPSIGTIIASTTPQALAASPEFMVVAWIVLGVIFAVLVVSMIISVFGRAAKSVLKRRR